MDHKIFSLLLLISFVASLEGMEQQSKRSLFGCFKKAADLDGHQDNQLATDLKNIKKNIRFADQNNNFKALVQATMLAQGINNHEKKSILKRIKKTKTKIKDCFIEKIQHTISTQDLEYLHEDLLEKIDFLDNMPEYEFLSTMLYERYLEIC